MYYHDIQKSTEVQVGPPPPDNRLPYRNGQTNIEAEQGRDSPDSGRRHYPRSAPGDVRYHLPAAAPPGPGDGRAPGGQRVYPGAAGRHSVQQAGIWFRGGAAGLRE